MEIFTTCQRQVANLTFRGRRTGRRRRLKSLHMCIPIRDRKVWAPSSSPRFRLEGCLLLRRGRLPRGWKVSKYPPDLYACRLRLWKITDKVKFWRRKRKWCETQLPFGMQIREKLVLLHHQVEWRKWQEKEGFKIKFKKLLTLLSLLYRDRLKSASQVWWILLLLLLMQHSRNLQHWI